MKASSRRKYPSCPCKVLLLTVVLVSFGLAASPAAAQIMIDLPTIRCVSINPTIVSPRDAIAVLGQDLGGQHVVAVMVIEKTTGQRVGMEQRMPLPAGITPVDILYSNLIRPGNILVLDSDLVIHEFEVAYDVNSRPKFTGMVHKLGPFGDAMTYGAGTALAEAPNADDSKLPFLAIGTDGGHLFVANAAGIAMLAEPRPDPILDLAVVSQVGHFAFVALTSNKLTGNTLTGINPRVSLAEPRPDPLVIFTLAEPRPDPLAEPRPDPFLSIFGTVFEPNDEPLTDPAPVSLVGMNGTATVSIVVIGECPVVGGIFSFSDFQTLFVPVVQGAVGSLALVPADGSGLLFDPGFQLGQGGISGTLLTVYGNSLQLSPATLKLSGKGQFVTAVIEISEGTAALIDPASVVLETSSGWVGASALFAAQLADDDGDGIADLKVKFDRSVVQAMLSGMSGPITATVRWQYTDGSSGSASAQINVIP